MTHIVYCVNRTANEYTYGFIWHSYEVLAYILNLISDLDHHVILKINHCSILAQVWKIYEITYLDRIGTRSITGNFDDFQKLVIEAYLDSTASFINILPGLEYEDFERMVIDIDLRKIFNSEQIDKLLNGSPAS